MAIVCSQVSFLILPDNHGLIDSSRMSGNDHLHHTLSYTEKILQEGNRIMFSRRKIDRDLFKSL